MANSKHTKRTLLASILSVAVCVTMLVGSTFAWFTDSVTSGNNKIVAGNLDIKLSYSTDLQNWNDVDANTNVFKEGPSGSQVIPRLFICEYQTQARWRSSTSLLSM